MEADNEMEYLVQVWVRDHLFHLDFALCTQRLARVGEAIPGRIFNKEMDGKLSLILEKSSWFEFSDSEGGFGRDFVNLTYEGEVAARKI